MKDLGVKIVRKAAQEGGKLVSVEVDRCEFLEEEGYCCGQCNWLPLQDRIKRCPVFSN